jgi:hypothetical protein
VSLPGEDEKKPLVENAANSDQVKKAKKTLKERRKLELQDLRELLKREDFQRFIWRLLNECRMWKSSFSMEPHVTSFNEGKRLIGTTIIRDLEEASPGASYKLAKFNHDPEQKA